ncbi:CD151 antigen-like isoform X2 [Ornithodoros turicata]|uniref:CD151 antigen-like isoform X2 n=1 Tax=Ornithodoros turicata TaxID=34597 RepID=UPI003138A0CC
MGSPNASNPRDTRMLEGCGKVVKYALFVANFIIMVGGVAVFAVGIWTLADRSFMERLLGTDLYVSSASILIATGVVVTIISFLGCLGAFKEIKCMLLTFFIILFMIFITMLVGGILGYVFRNEVDDRMYQEMIMSIPMYKNDSVVTDAWDAVQQHFECCGVRTERYEPFRVWSLKNSHFNSNHQVPESCCRKKEWLHACLKQPTSRDTYMDSCHEKVRDFVKGHAVIVGGMGIGISCLLVVGMVLSCAMFLMIR